MSKLITADMTIYEAIKLNPACAEILVSVGMNCLGCSMARGETIEQAAAVHGQNADDLVRKMNAVK